MTDLTPISPFPVGPFPAFAGSITQVTPFTYRNGLTYLEVLEGMREWLNLTLLPAVQDMATELDDEWAAQYGQLVTFVNDSITQVTTALEAAQTAATTATDAANTAEAAAAQAGTQQDNSITALFNKVDSAFRTATNLAYASKATQTTVETGRLSPENMALLASQQYVDSALGPVSDNTGANKSRLDAFDTLTTGGRLGQSAMDTRYSRVQPAPHAVFIGSSNAVVGTWPEAFSADMGYVAHNYSVGGGGFTGSGSGAFLAQAQTAIADTSYDHSLVKFFFICDMGNDIRGSNLNPNPSLYGNIQATLAAIRTAYPQARIILLPCLWGNTPVLNNNGNCIAAISSCVQVAKNAGLPFDMEMVEWSWTWHGDTGDWMKPGEVHYKPAGYDRIRYFMKLYMRGGSTRYDTGSKLVTPNTTNTNPDYGYWRARRTGNITEMESTFLVTNPVGVDTDLGNLDYGLWPITSARIVAIANSTRAAYTLQVYGVDSNGPGLIRSFGGLPADTFDVRASWYSY